MPEAPLDSGSSKARLIRAVLRSYGHTLSEDLGIKTETNRPQALFCLLIASLLASARIRHEIALKTAHILFQRGWNTPQKMLETTWEQRVQALDEGGYARYDERTATMLGQTSQMVIERYGGDLRKLRDAAGRDPEEERRLLKEFKGIGDVGADVFFRDVQLAWTELFPFADKRVLASAEKLGLPNDPKRLSALVRGRREFVRLVAALIWIELEGDESEKRKLKGKE